jgi:hypothetical protein
LASSRFLKNFSYAVRLSSLESNKALMTRFPTL